MQSTWLVSAVRVAIVALLLSLAWQPAMQAPYQYDDTITPQGDPASQSLTSWAQALPRTLRPLTKLSYALESSLGAREAPARRVSNGVMLIAATLLLAALMQRAGLARWLALALAALWAVHPVHAETVVALAGRSVLLSLTLMLGSALCVLRERRSWALVLAVLAVLARETAILWLISSVLLIMSGRASKRRIALGSAGAVVLGAGLVLVSARMRELLQFSFQDPAALDRLGRQWAAVPRGLLLWFAQPQAFTVDMEFDPRGGVRVGYLLATLLLYSSFTWLALRGASRVVRVAALLWLSLVLPLHSLVPKLDPLTARSVSASSAALVILLAVLLAKLKGAQVQRVCLGVVALAILGLGLATRSRAALYRDPVALWRDAANRSQRSTRPLVNLGTLLAQKGQLEEARTSLREAVRRDPYSSDARERLRGVETLIETQRLLTDPAGRGNNSGR